MTRFSGPGDSPGFLLWHVTLAWQRRVRETLEPLGLTHVQFVLLACCWWLEEQGSPPRQQELAAQAGTDVKMTSQVIARLESKELVTRAVDAGDTRAKLVRLTAEGRRLVTQAVQAVEQVDESMFGTDASALAQTLRDILKD
ncbi:MarR family winged helix-turn-helix transcriptional regulator [Amycolatopsis benzoatilytica]|uniref:MarR family winged helix-turn-helix transcriptional regulator n=1 Tax=Amycolatopsis benzoatilytica TaxID=346045 RepID=UPI000372AE7B|nr:MarR family transcriptional regulator [Amycolatopsis benzoatilytica]